MLSSSSTMLDVLKGSYVAEVTGQIWRGGKLIADSVPIVDGNIEIDRSQFVPETLSFTVPRYDGITNWAPTDQSSPLAPFGQRISLQYGVRIGAYVEWIQQGWFLITDTVPNGDDLTVTAYGLLRLIDEARFAAPFKPANTFADTLRALVEPALTIAVSPSLVDRSLPKSLQWDTDRSTALTDMLNSWGAEAVVTPDGYLSVYPAVDDTALISSDSVWTLTDDASTGTVVKWTGDLSRGNAYNCVVAQGEDSDGNQIQGVVYDNEPTSPTYIHGPFSPMPVPLFYYSPLLNTLAECTKAATTVLTKRKRNQNRMISAESVPNPLLRPGDPVMLNGDALSNRMATIETMTFPLFPGGGTHRFSLTLLD